MLKIDSEMENCRIFTRGELQMLWKCRCYPYEGY